MKTIILAGGHGTRFGRVTDFLPKPMIPIGPLPILWHIMRYYASYGHNDFIIATGYKSELIKEFFVNLSIYCHDFTVDFSKSDLGVVIHAQDEQGFRPRVTVCYTGQEAMTGSRIKQVEPYVENDENFFLTYGDGLSDVNLDSLLQFHLAHGCLATLTAVFPPPKFGNLTLRDSVVTNFSEKKGTNEGFVNGGFYVFNRGVFDYLKSDYSCVLEKSPLESIAQAGQLQAYKHSGFWQCMDTTRDLDLLQEEWNSGNARWKRWTDGYSR